MLIKIMMSNADYLNILVHLFSALVAGGAIGLERSFHGRPAGFRTHALVCLTSSLLMLVTLYQTQWMPDAAHDMIRIDPTRTAQ
ncbi:MgtC/SapB family protein, partial [Rhizobium hidalgonense]